MDKSENIFELIQYLNGQSEFLFDNLITWFIFYCSLNLTGLISGYLAILNADKIDNEEILSLKDQLLYWGSISFYFSTYVAIIGMMTLIAFFVNKQSEIDRLVDKVNSDILTIPSFTTPYWTFITITLLFVTIVFSFTIMWYRIRLKNRFESPYHVIFNKKSLKKQ